MSNDPPVAAAEALAEVILRSMDRMFANLVDRLSGLDAQEYLWEPVERMWSVRDTPRGPEVDGAGVREIDPPPMPTIAWRLWHITIDCFDDYTRRFGGNMDDALPAWTLDPADAVKRMQDAWATYRHTVSSQSMDAKLGANWEHWAELRVADMAMHASNELVHHAAEIALLRDLYRDSPTGPSV